MQKSIYTVEQKEFLKLIREVRMEAGLTQEKLAARLKTSQSRITDYERGSRRMDLMELQQLCEAIGIPLETFVGKYIERTRPIPE